jgi:Zn-dependent protease/CBS domain-containing protein
MKRRPVSLGRLFGIEIRLHLSWLPILILVTILALISPPSGQAQLSAVSRVTVAAMAAALFFGSVLAHELAHALVARRTGAQVGEIVLYVIGGATRLEQESRDPRTEMAIAAAGPLLNLALGLACLAPWLLTTSGGGELAVAFNTLLLWVCVSNLFLAAANLLPAFPLDGARLVRAVAWAATGDSERATRAASIIGRAMGWSLVGAGVAIAIFDDVAIGLWIVVVGWFLRQAAEGSLRRATVERLVHGLRVGDVMLHDYPVITQNLTLDTLEQQTARAGGSVFIPVVQEGNLAGAVDRAAISRVPRGRWPTTRVAEVMRSLEALATVTASDSLWAAVMRFDDARVEGLPVVDAVDRHRLVGLLTRDSLVDTLRLRRKAQAASASGLR